MIIMYLLGVIMVYDAIEDNHSFIRLLNALLWPLRAAFAAYDQFNLLLDGFKK